MIIFFIIIVFYLTTILYKIENNELKNIKINSTLLPVYKLGDNKYITSAHYIDYENRIVLIIYSNNRFVCFIKCIIKYSTSDENCMPNMQKTTTSFYYQIDLPTKPGDIPLYLFINNISVAINNTNRKNTDSFIVCIPIIVNLDRSLMLIQTIESHKTFGVGKVVVNYHSASNKVNKVLNYYKKIGFIDIYQFNNSVDERFREIELDNCHYIYHFQMWKINQCFFEYKTPMNHIMVLDVDEVLWPKYSKNYKEMFKSLPKMDFYFIHEFYYKIDVSVLDVNDHNVTLTDIDIFSINKYCPTPNNYSNTNVCRKYIIYNTNKVVKAKIHEATFKGKIKKQYIPNSIAFVRHTRHFNSRITGMCKLSMLNTNKSYIEYKIKLKSKSIYKKILKEY